MKYNAKTLGLLNSEVHINNSCKNKLTTIKHHVLHCVQTKKKRDNHSIALLLVVVFKQWMDVGRLHKRGSPSKVI